MSRVFDSISDDLRGGILRMGGYCEAILEKSIRSLNEKDVALAEEVQADDLDIDRLDLEIDERVLKALALQAPVASDLRMVLAAKMIATDLERVGDIARNIAKSARRISKKDMQLPLPSTLGRLAVASQRALRRALDAYTQNDADLAREVLRDDDVIDEQQDSVVRRLLQDLEAHPQAASQEVDAILVAKNLERVADHATNIAEQVILVVEAQNLKHADKLGRGDD
ncbi:MAG: phosphate signaling complex protein PhoU [Myxococcota bacterium]